MLPTRAQGIGKILVNLATASMNLFVYAWFLHYILGKPNVRFQEPFFKNNKRQHSMNCLFTYAQKH